MHAMAKALLEWETIDADQINDIMSGQDPRPPSRPSGPPTSGGTPAKGPAAGVAADGAAAPA
jgi:cell division protease FtsH